MPDEEQLLRDTPKSRRAVTTIYTDEQEERALGNILETAQRILANTESSTPDRRWAADVIKNFGQLKHGKVEVDVPHFRLSIKDVFGHYIDITNKVGVTPEVMKNLENKPEIKKETYYQRSKREKREAVAAAKEKVRLLNRTPQQERLDAMKVNPNAVAETIARGEGAG